MSFLPVRHSGIRLAKNKIKYPCNRLGGDAKQASSANFLYRSVHSSDLTRPSRPGCTWLIPHVLASRLPQSPVNTTKRLLPNCVRTVAVYRLRISGVMSRPLSLEKLQGLMVSSRRSGNGWTSISPPFWYCDVQA